MQTKQKARFTKQDDPYKVYEQLHLSLEEVCTMYKTVKFQVFSNFFFVCTQMRIKPSNLRSDSYLLAMISEFDIPISDFIRLIKQITDKQPTNG